MVLIIKEKITQKGVVTVKIGEALRQFWYDDRGATTAEPLPRMLLGAAAALALAHGLQHRQDHLSLGSLAALPLAAGGTKEKRGWEWDCGGGILLAERNTARDAKLARVPPKGYEKSGAIHTGEKEVVVAWEWPGDGRVFLVPVELLGNLRTSISLCKDVVIVVGHMYREQNYPSNRIITTSYRQLADMLALGWAGGKTIEDLDQALTLARWLTIQNYPVIRQLTVNGNIKEMSRDTFGFINQISRITIREGKQIPRNRQSLEITISELYALMLRRLPAAPVPVAALEAAHKAPQRVRTPVKSMAYYLASRVPLSYVQLSLSNLAAILGYRNPRKNELRQAVENVANILRGIIIADYHPDDDGETYTFNLAGKPIQPLKNGR